MVKNFVWSTVLLGLFTACTGRQAETSRPQPVAKTQAEEFSITVMEGGGFTGMVNGFTLSSDGKVTGWKQAGAGQRTVDWETTADVEPINKLRMELDKSGLMGSNIENPGNMSKTVILEKEGTRQRWVWSSQDDVPEDASKWYRAVNEFCRQLAP